MKPPPPQSVRLSPANLEYVRKLVADSGLSMAVTVDALISGCRRHGWTVAAAGPARVIEPPPEEEP